MPWTYYTLENPDAPTDRMQYRGQVVTPDDPYNGGVYEVGKHRQRPDAAPDAPILPLSVVSRHDAHWRFGDMAADSGRLGLIVREAIEWDPDPRAHYEQKRLFGYADGAEAGEAFRTLWADLEARAQRWERLTGFEVVRPGEAMTLGEI